jgi:CRP-like cAMP-binding protein
MYDRYFKSLVKIPLFQNIPPDQLQTMLLCLNPIIRHYGKGEIIVLAGDVYNGVGIVLSGSVMITKENAAGTRQIMGFSHMGDMFGEIAAFSSDNLWPATVYAHEHSAVMFLPPALIVGECSKMCPSHRTMIVNLLHLVSERAMRLNRKIQYMSIKTIKGKISHYLIELYRKTGSLTLMLPVKRNELADFFNVSRPSLSREMGLMKEEGLIDFHMSSVRILNLSGLRKLTEDI